MDLARCLITQSCALPLFGMRVSAGFPSPADDYIERPLDLNEFLVSHPAATFYARAKGEAMRGAGVLDGDYLVVDRSLQAAHGSLVLVPLEGELVLRRLRLLAQGYELCAAHPNYAPLRFGPEAPLQVWGVVTAVVRKVR